MFVIVILYFIILGKYSAQTASSELKLTWLNNSYFIEFAIVQPSLTCSL